MDRLQNYRAIIEKILVEYEKLFPSDETSRVELIFDRDRDRYIATEIGWQSGYRIYGTLLHLDIIEDKVWIQQDATETGIANELIIEGIERERIVLAYRSIENRDRKDLAFS